MKKSKWTRSQIDLLIQKAKTGNVRMHAFEEVARQTSRKANSVRNYYYKNLAAEKIKIAPFPPAEVRQMLREIVLGTSRGESVRSICLRLAQNDKSKMLRFQNKYRTVLRKQPERIEDIKTMLEGQGYLVKSPVISSQSKLKRTPAVGGMKSQQADIVTLPVSKDKSITDADINNLFMGLMRLVKNRAVDARVDGLTNQVETLKAEIERLKTNANAFVK